MRLQACHKGHRFRLPHWPPYQFIDIRLVGHAHIVAVEETGQELIFDRDDLELDWLHLGATPHPYRRRTDQRFE